jgi:hypothetical protein
MADNQSAPLFQEGNKVFAGPFHIGQLFLEGTFLAGAQQRIAAERYHNKFFHSLVSS